MKTKTSSKDLDLRQNEVLYTSNVSPFKPSIIKNLIPSGLKLFSFKAGFKKNSNDLLIVIFDKLVNACALYSQTSTPSAPIIWDKKNNKGNCRVLVVNSGNANAHTGTEGLKLINKYVFELTKIINCKKEEVLVSSTGVIGELFKSSLIVNSIRKIHKSKTTNLVKAAQTIMTTDTYPKTSIINVKIENIKIKIYGFAKGSGMVNPNMGTMLAYIFIDCFINKNNLKRLLKDNIEDTFNSISVDSDTSTSDTIMLFSVSKNKINLKNKKNYNLLSKNLHQLMGNLSSQIIKDGEGVSKIIEVNIVKAKNFNQAKNIGFSIVNSPLVKTAISGEDANWGRVIMAIGKSYEKIYQNKIKVSFGNNIVCKGGQIYKKINYKKLNNYMKKNIIKIEVDLNLGNFSKTVLGNDLTYNYLKINADYRS